MSGRWRRGLRTLALSGLHALSVNKPVVLKGQ